jgi:succinoglycan biosynthesis protein ExoA
MSTNRLKILHLRASNFVGGPERQLLRYAEQDHNGPWDLVFGVYVGEEEGREFRDSLAARGIDVVSLPVEMLASSVASLTRVLHEKQIGLICSHGYKADIVSLIAGRMAGVPVSCFLRGWTSENRRVRFYETLDKISLRFADRIVCLSRSQAARISRENSLSSKIRIVGNAINTSEINPAAEITARAELQRRFELTESCVLVATGGRLSPEKGVEDFISAAVLVKQSNKNVRFLVFGSGPQQAGLEHQVSELGLKPYVTFAGFERDLRRLLPGIDLLVNPSHSEEMPNIVLEGMAEGIPVVATAVGGVEEIAGPQNAVRLVPPAQPEVQAAAIIELLAQPDIAKNLAQAGHDRVKQAYSVEAQKEQYHQLYEEILPRPRALREATKHCSPSAQFCLREGTTLAGATYPFLSIVLPIRNEEGHIAAVLSQLEQQEYPQDRYEVLVAVGSSTDKTVEVVEEFRKQTGLSLRHFDNPKILSSAGRNVGARNAQGDYIIFIDGHCEINSKTFLADAASLFQSTGADCLCRPQPLTAKGNSLFQDVVAQVRASSLGHGTDSTIYDTGREGSVNPSSAGAMYRRSVFERIGYYDESFDACEDVEFNHRVFKARLASYISPKLAVTYHPRERIVALWRQMVRYGRGRVRLIKKHPDAFSFGQMVPAALLIWLICGGIVSVIWPPFLAAFVVCTGTYAALVLGFSVRLGLRHGAKHALLAPLTYLTIHLGLGAGFLAEVFRFRRANPSEPRTLQKTPMKSRPLDPPFSIGT